MDICTLIVRGIFTSSDVKLYKRGKGKILTYTKLTSAILKNKLWECKLKNS